ncbi:hypothetical protein PIROE2DRAFT_11280, partial [Piromyces sp. E2]
LNFESSGILCSYSKKEISVIRTQPLNLYIIQKDKLKFILKFQSIPLIARIDYCYTSIGKSKLKYKNKDSLLELYVLTMHGELCQIYLNFESEDIQYKNNSLKDSDGKIIKKKKIVKSKEKSNTSSNDIYPITISIKEHTEDNKKNNDTEILIIENDNIIEYDKIYTYNQLYQSDDVKIVSPYTLYSTDIPSIANENQETNSDNLFINDSNYYINKNLFKKLFETERIHLIGTNNGEVYWMDNIYVQKPKLLINIEEPVIAFHIIILKSDDNNDQKNRKSQHFSFNDMNIRTTPKNLNSNALMIIGVILLKIISNESTDFIIKKKYHITNPIYSSCVINHYLFVTSKYYDGSRKITFYDLLNEEKEEDFKDILIPKIYPNSKNVQNFKCIVINHDNIIYQQLYLNGLYESGVFNILNLSINNEKNNNQKEFTNPSKIIMPILEDINKLSKSIEEYKQDHKILNNSISSMNETIFFLISFIDYINKNEYKELPISCNMIMKYHPQQYYYSIVVSLKFKIPITGHWICNYFVIYKIIKL